MGGIPLSPCRGTIMAPFLLHPGLFGAPQSLPSAPPCWIARVCRGGFCRGPAVLGACFASAVSPSASLPFWLSPAPPPLSSHMPKGLLWRIDLLTTTACSACLVSRVCTCEFTSANSEDTCLSMSTNWYQEVEKISRFTGNQKDSE